MFFFKMETFLTIFLHSNYFMLWSPVNDKHIYVIFREIVKSKLLNFFSNKVFLLTTPTFLVYSYFRLFCYSQLETRLTMLHFHNFAVKNVPGRGECHFCALATLTPSKVLKCINSNSNIFPPVAYQ